MFRSILLLTAMLFLTTGSAQADMEDDCVQTDDPDLRIGGCTVAIQSGQWAGENLAKAYNNRGHAYNILGQYTRAIADYDQALRLAPNDAIAYNGRGFTYHKFGQFSRAIEDYNRALQLNPDYVLAYNNRGIAYERLGEFDKAVQDWESAMRIEGSPSVKRWQKYLKGKGQYAGAIDGKYGSGTRAALVACARDPQC